MRTILAILLILLLLSTRKSIAQTADSCSVEKAVSLLLESEPGNPATIEQFVRLLPVAYGFSDSAFYKLPADILFFRLDSLGIITKDIDININGPLTKGRVSVVLAKTLLLAKASILENIMIRLFNSPDACFRLTLREKLVPPGNTEDVVTTKELAAIILVITTITKYNLLPLADEHCINLLAAKIIKEVVDLEEIKAILKITDTDSIDAILAL